MRDYSYLDEYYSELLADIYPQPPDKWHLDEMNKAILQWIAPIKLSTVFDVGCGEAEAQEFFESEGMHYLGCAQGQDVRIGADCGRKIIGADFNFLIDMDDNRWDLVFSRHSLEHSPMPLLTLMEWHRISSKWLCLIIPNPEHFTRVGRNHYSVMDATQTAWLLRRAGWKIRKLRITQKEFWFLCSKEKRVGYEGWAEAPTSHVLYEFERDLKDFKGEMDVDAYFATKVEEEDKYEKWVNKMRRKGLFP
ncbi:MAG: class I SAM-dependent methyltransferase [Candidatus Hodarchaeales archaeon]|jgi:SAM-dependent methyltransferase